MNTEFIGFLAQVSDFTVLLSCCCCCCCFRKQPLRYNSVGARIDGLTPPGDYPAAETHYVIAESTGIVQPVQGQAVPMGTPV